MVVGPLLAGVRRGEESRDGKALTDVDRRGALDGDVAEVDVRGGRRHTEEARDAADLALVRRVEQRRRSTGRAAELAAGEGADIRDDLGRRRREDVELARRAGGRDADVLADAVRVVRRAHRVITAV